MSPRTLLSGVLPCAFCALNALPLADNHRATGGTLEIHLSGSSAQDNAVERLMRLVCKRGTLDV